MSAWSCPHDLDGVCQRVQGARCDPGMNGCVLAGKVVFASAEKNAPRKPVKAAPSATENPAPAAPAKPRRRLPF